MGDWDIIVVCCYVFYFLIINVFFLNFVKFCGNWVEKEFLCWIDNNFLEMDGIKLIFECFWERFNI